MGGTTSFRADTPLTGKLIVAALVKPSAVSTLPRNGVDESELRPKPVIDHFLLVLRLHCGDVCATLTPSSLAPLTRISSANACGSDGINSICFDQADAAFTPGVLAFTRVITADVLGQQIGSSASSTEIGQILDADIYFDPTNSQVTFATPTASPASPNAYELESVLTHELGHFLGFSHSAIWSAMMYPYAPAPGTFNGLRSTVQQPDLPLSDDDRAGLRILYPDPSDTLHVGSISGRVLPANPLSLPQTPRGVTGIFGAHVVAVDSASGAVIAEPSRAGAASAPGRHNSMALTSSTVCRSATATWFTPSPSMAS